MSLLWGDFKFSLQANDKRPKRKWEVLTGERDLGIINTKMVAQVQSVTAFWGRDAYLWGPL